MTTTHTFEEREDDRFDGLSRRRFLLGALFGPAAIPLLGTASEPDQLLAATEESPETENNWEGPFYKPGAPVRSVLVEGGMAGTDVNLLDSGGNSPLLHAAMRGRTAAVRLLLEHGANVNTASKHGWTPLMTAAWEGHADVVKDLLKHGANASLVNRERRSALMLAESEGHREVVKLLGAK